MNQQFQNLFDFLKTPFPYFCIIASLAVSICLIGYDDFSVELQEKSVVINEKTSDLETRAKISFCTYGGYSPSPAEEIVSLIFYVFIAILGLIFILPSAFATVVFMYSLQSYFPNIDIETIKFITLWAFIYFNCNYWLLLSFFTKTFHDSYQENLVINRNSLTIYSNVR